MRELYADMWRMRSDCDALVITTNGFIKKDGTAVMGRGVAQQAAARYPVLPRILGDLLQRWGRDTAGMQYVADLYKLKGGATFVSFPVKHNWWERADLALIERSARQLVSLAGRQGWKKVVLPRPGCGNGGLSWEEVKPILEPLLDDRFVCVAWPPPKGKEAKGGNEA